MFHKGQATVIQDHVMKDAKKYIAGSQSLFHRDFPDGRRIKELDTVEKLFVVENPKSGETKEFKFDYTSEGAHIMGLAVAPNKTICGGTAFPMRFFSFDPATDKWINRRSYIQWNTVGTQGDKFFVGGYTGGFMLEWDPAKPWVDTEPGNPDSNPLFLGESKPTINRPHRLLPHPDGKLVIMAGGPDYGLTGGGMLIWDRAAKAATVLTDKELIPDQSTVSLVALPKGKVLGGSTTSPGTGGEKKAKEAELYVMDLATKKIEWHEVAIPGVQEYTDMTVGPKGLVYGFADRSLFFVFDPAKRQVVHQQSTLEDIRPDLLPAGTAGVRPRPEGPDLCPLHEGHRRRRAGEVHDPDAGRIAGAGRVRRGLPRRAHLLCQRLARLQLRRDGIARGRFRSSLTNGLSRSGGGGRFFLYLFLSRSRPFFRSISALKESKKLSPRSPTSGSNGISMTYAVMLSTLN